MQADLNHDGIGDICGNNFDGDGTDDQLDVCPKNGQIEMTDFRNIQVLQNIFTIQ